VVNWYLLRKAKTNDVTPTKAGVHSEKTGFPLEFIPHTMRGGNDNEECRIPIKTIGTGIELSSSPSI